MAMKAQLWHAVADAFGELRGAKARDLWLSDAEPESFHRGLFTLIVPSEAVKLAIDARYRDDLETLFLQLTGSPVRIRTLVDTGETIADRTTSLPPVVATPDGNLVLAAPFVATDANRLAVLAVEKFVLASDSDFNPLVVFGPEGCGKTALARYALELLRRAGEARDPLVLSGDGLTRDVSRAARRGQIGALQDSWRRRDLVILDEVHRLRGRRRAQAETAALIEAAISARVRVLMLSRHAPREIHELDDRLRSHMLRGMLVAIPAPDRAQREAVLAAVAGALAVPVDTAVITTLAAHHPGSLTDVVARLRELAEEARRSGVPLDVERLDNRLIAPGRAALRLDELIETVAEALGVEPDRVRSAEKTRPVALARHLCIYLATQSLRLSARQVCRSMGLKSPSVVPYARRAVERRRRNDAGFERLVLTLVERLDGAQRDLPW